MKNKDIYVLVNNKIKNSEIKDICVSFNQNEIIEYQKRVEFETIIEKRQYEGGWSDGIKYSDLFLKTVDGELYIKRNINRANAQRDKRLSLLRNAHMYIKEFARETSETNKQSYDIVLKDIESKFEDMQNSKLDIELT